MKKFFEQPNEEELAKYILAKLYKYQEEGHRISDLYTIYQYFTIVMHFLLTQRPEEEQNVRNLLKLVGTTQKEAGFRSVFFNIMNRFARENPEDAYFKQALRLEQKLTRQNIKDINKFCEWMLLQEKEDDFRNEMLGELMISRLRYRHKKPDRIMLSRENGNTPGLSKSFIEECRQFVENYPPKKIKAYLDEHIIGQEEAKRNISIAVYNHYLRILYPDKKLIKSNVIMIGPSGCGKTEIIRQIAKLVNVPVIISDFSGVVATPWKGRNKEEALLNLYHKAKDDVALTERGIVFYDEFDKIIPVQRSSRGDDINLELQGQMLGMMEGTTLEVPVNSQGDRIYLETDNMLFICAGAFEGLEDIVKKDMPESEGGFGMPLLKNEEVEITENNIRYSHLIQYGMKPELAGRIGVLSVLRKLSREDLRRILTQPKDSIVQKYKNEFQLENVELSFTPGALEAVIDKVMEMNIGARALNAVMHDILLQAMFEVPGRGDIREVIITEDTVRNEAEAEYH